MEKNVFITLLIGMILLAEFRYEQNLKLKKIFHFKKTPQLIQDKRLDLIKLSSPVVGSIYTAASSGYKIKIPKPTLNIWKKLGILHLLTPSGIHLTVIMVLFARFKNFNRYLEYIFLLMVLTIGGFFSMERILFIKISKKFKLPFAFISGILISLLIGHYQASPLSFIYSFVFLGIFYSRSKKILTSLTLAHLIICWFNNTEFYLLAPVFNFGLTAIFSFFFPFILISFWLPIEFMHHIGVFIINFFLMLSEYAFEVLKYTFIIQPSLILFLIILSVLLRKKSMGIALLSIFYTTLN